MSVKENIENKIMSNLEDALDLISTWRNNKEKIVFTNGCFDLFHAGHAHSLVDAARYGTKLIVGLNDDSSVHKLKGNNRPFNKLSYRAFVLASLQVVDLVIPFSELNPENLIRAIIPDVLAKGSDYTLENIAGAAFVLENKGDVVRIPLLPDISSTKMAEFMLNKND
ncbi:MAG: adenylyltransferase/cytidyltransferase family protein [Saprospiraceae bacterium]|nr:adenylyltransferase/cytidyltransferase family protein [Saprospiraceae bacterium]